jgi:hypothetical protein
VFADDQVPLTRAAALHANFPPVFTNAAVDVPVSDRVPDELDGVRYWVTDGGAVENRGVLSLLFALRAAVRQEIDQRAGAGGPAPRFHVLVAEASGESTSYSSLPGLSSRFGAPAQLGSQLMKELQNEIQTAMEELGGKMDIHYLAMPGQLRVDGGLGTHWMLPGKIRLSAPEICSAEARERHLDGETPKTGTQVRNAIYDLFVPEDRRDPTFRCEEDKPRLPKDETERMEVEQREAEAVRVILERVESAACLGVGTDGPLAEVCGDLASAETCWREDWRNDWHALKQELASAQAAPSD